jgi:hypothetical protein
MAVDKFVLTSRDVEVLKLVYRFRFCLGRHVKDLVEFPSARTVSRRLKLLVEAKYLERKKYLYGVPYLYTLAHKGRTFLGVNKRAEKIRLERIWHDCLVLDTFVYFKKKGVSLSDILTEKELYSQDGFGRRRHFPDLVIIKDGKKTAVEVELTLKAKERIEENCKDNCLVYDAQVWLISKDATRLRAVLTKLQEQYFNVEIMHVEDAKDD